ncbi:MAG: hypothetical protein CMH30_02570 [Micavibrio sp.]|nr:hypothetical protein [Micavibrio sp.]|tara:strand:+ start:1080 stop:2225 length:1146 start_codon:yes stop_codon:yes gene_type:complete
MAGLFDKIANLQVSAQFESKAFFISLGIILLPFIFFLGYGATLNGQAYQLRTENLAATVAHVERAETDISLETVDVDETAEQLVQDVIESAPEEQQTEIETEEQPAFSTIDIDDLLYDRSENKWQPRKAPSGETVFGAYKADLPANIAVNSAQKPKIAIIFIDVDAKTEALKKAQETLSKTYSFGFNPYDQALEEKTKLSHENGFESWLMLPTEPTNYPYNDRGPLSLLTNDKKDIIQTKLAAIAYKAPYVIGMLGYTDTLFMDNESRRAIVSSFLNNIGFAYIHGVNDISVQGDVAQAIPYAEKDIVIDSSAKPKDIANTLVQLETIAQNTGYAIGYAHLYDTTLKTLENWNSTLSERGILLVPASSITKGTFTSSQAEE